MQLPASHSNSCPQLPRAPGRKHLLFKVPEAFGWTAQKLHVIFLMEPTPSIASPIHSLFALLQALTKNRINDTTHQFRKLFHLCFSINKSKAIGSLKERPGINWRLCISPLQVFLPLQSKWGSSWKRTITWLGSASIPYSSHPTQVLLSVYEGQESSQPRFFKSKEIRLWKTVAMILD